MIEKPSILITSLGRTGTEFFAKFYAAILPDSFSVHEPDIFPSAEPDKWMRFFVQVKRAGIRQAVFRKALGKWTLVKLSDDKFLGRLSPEQAARELMAQRDSFIRRQPGFIYIEANNGYYGLLDVAPRVFQHHKAVYIIRDGRDWVRSQMNWGEFYGKKGLRKLIAHNWPPASALPQDPYAEQWNSLSRFEKLCWAWTRLNEYALSTLEKNPNARVFQFEKIFSGEGRYKTLEELVAFTTSQPGMDAAKVGAVDGWLERKIHQSSGSFPAWEGWTSGQKEHFNKLCGQLMEKMGYQDKK
jgi:hypothetical protein